MSDVARQLATEVLAGDHASFLVLQDHMDEQDPTVAKVLRNGSPEEKLVEVCRLSGVDVKASSEHVWLPFVRAQATGFPLLTFDARSDVPEFAKDVEVVGEPGDNFWSAQFVRSRPPGRSQNAGDTLCMFLLHEPLNSPSDVDVINTDPASPTEGDQLETDDRTFRQAKQVQLFLSKVVTRLDAFLADASQGLDEQVCADLQRVLDNIVIA